MPEARSCTAGVCVGIPPDDVECDPPAGGCAVSPLSDSSYCGDTGTDCGDLASLSTGCVGSHTEQVCTDACGRDFVLVGGDDAATRYYDVRGQLAAVHVLAGATDECDGWFGLDLSSCEPMADPVTVTCDSSGP